MGLKSFHRIIKAASCLPILFSALSCIEIDHTLGDVFIPTDQQFSIHVVDIPIDSIDLRKAEDLAAISSTRITVGALRDEEFGLTTRSSAFPLIPIIDTVDFGRDPQFKFFFFSVDVDTISTADNYQNDILQEINVFELESPVNLNTSKLNDTIHHKNTRITKSIPATDGKSSLSFYFTDEFASKYMSMTQEDIKDYDKFVEKFPGIYLTCEEPIGNGGRINMFDAQLGYTAQAANLQGNYAQLAFSAYFGNETERRDTSILFYFGADRFCPVDSLFEYYAKGSFSQFIVNTASHESDDRIGTATDKIYIEGGGGLKPVISAKELKSKLKDAISVNGDPSKALINKATLFFPYEYEEDETELQKYPEYLSPQCLIKFNWTDEDGKEYTDRTFYTLTDAASSSENQGDINRSLCLYSPDISYHAQALLKMSDTLSNMDNYDIWLIIKANETIIKGTTNSTINSYYQQMMYMNYINQMYGGYGGYGYGGYGYGGYGGYGGYYDNSYYYMMNAMYTGGIGDSSTSSSIIIDRDRYYKGILYGPKADEDKRPFLRVVYTVSKE